jgi:hypothetical protein
MCLPNCHEWIILFLGTFFWSAVLYLVRPAIKIAKIIKINENGRDGLKITVKNKGHFLAVTNLMVEACIVVERQTCHLKLDKYNFIMLPAKKGDTDFHERDFKTLGLENSGCDDGQGHEIKNENYVANLQEYENYIIRVRVHANHEFTNFGKAFEFNFRYDGAKFIKI